MTDHSPAVDLVVNVFERDYREVLASNLIGTIVESCDFRFTEVTALINNVEDATEAARQADLAMTRGLISRWAFVADLVESSLQIAGLRMTEMERLRHFNDAPLVAATMSGPEWFVWWEPDVELLKPCDWISPSVSLMRSDPRIMCSGPRWTDGTIDRETVFTSGDFAYTRGFSTQLFLGRRGDFRAPIYSEKCVSRWRFPMSHIGMIFESRLDSWMRHNGKYRAAYLPASYLHTGPPGRSYPEALTSERIRYIYASGMTHLLRRSPILPSCCKPI